MNLLSQIEFMDFMMNVKEDIMLEYGDPLQIYLIGYQLLQLLMKKFYVCMEG